MTNKYKDTSKPKPQVPEEPGTPQQQAFNYLSGADVQAPGDYSLPGFLKFGEPGDIITRGLLRGGLNSLFLSAPWFRKAIDQMTNFALLSQIAGAGGDLGSMINTGQIGGAFDTGALQQLFRTLTGQTGASTPEEASYLGKQLGMQQQGIQGPAGPLTPEEQAQAQGNMSAFGPGVAGQFVSPLQALLTANPNFLSSIIGTTTAGNLGQQALLSNYVQNYLLPTYGAFQPESIGSGSDVLTILNRLLGGK